MNTDPLSGGSAQHSAEAEAPRTRIPGCRSRGRGDETDAPRTHVPGRHSRDRGPGRRSRGHGDETEAPRTMFQGTVQTGLWRRMGAGEEADTVVRKVWCSGDCAPAPSTRSSWSW